MGIEAASVATEIVLLTGVIAVLESLEATVAGAATAAAQEEGTGATVPAAVGTGATADRHRTEVIGAANAVGVLTADSVQRNAVQRNAAIRVETGALGESAEIEANVAIVSRADLGRSALIRAANGVIGQIAASEGLSANLRHWSKSPGILSS